jgi:hypothetical protein
MSGVEKSQAWPELPLEAWSDTCATLHLWTQNVGKIRMARTPAVNHCWHVPDAVTREAYSHEVSSCGFWPGGGPVPHAAFYSYVYPEPGAFRQAKIKPRESFYSADLGEFILPYDTVRQSPSPDDTLLDFLQTTYDAAADLARWDRAALERR